MDAQIDRMRSAVEFQDNFAFSRAKNPALARRTAHRMRHWFGFLDEGIGDRICEDTAALPPAIVFDQHDWFDGGSGANGMLLGESFSAFMSGWSNV